jgi:hypothetical protein
MVIEKVVRSRQTQYGRENVYSEEGEQHVDCLK